MLDRAVTDPAALARRLSGHHLIGGRLVAAGSGATFAVVNPATGLQIGRAARGDAADVDTAVRDAAAVQKAWAKMPARKRGLWSPNARPCWPRTPTSSAG